MSNAYDHAVLAAKARDFINGVKVNKYNNEGFTPVSPEVKEYLTECSWHEEEE